MALMAFVTRAPPWFTSATTGAPQRRAISTTLFAQTSGEPWIVASSNTQAWRLYKSLSAVEAQTTIPQASLGFSATDGSTPITLRGACGGRIPCLDSEIISNVHNAPSMESSISP